MEAANGAGDGAVNGIPGGTVNGVPGAPGAVLQRWRHALAGRLRREKAAYSGGEERPLGGYLGAMACYGAYVTALTALARRTGRRAPARVAPWDLAVVTAATFQLTRLLAKGPVTSPLRAPFTRYQGLGAPAELQEEVRGTGPRKAVGELLTCPFCLGVWVSTTLVAGLVVCPGPTRLGSASLAATAGSDALQFVYTALAEGGGRGGSGE